MTNSHMKSPQVVWERLDIQELTIEEMCQGSGSFNSNRYLGSGAKCSKKVFGVLVL